MRPIILGFHGTPNVVFTGSRYDIPVTWVIFFVRLCRRLGFEIVPLSRLLREPKKFQIALTFDDGLRSNLNLLDTVLTRDSLSATLMINPANVAPDIKGKNDIYLNWSELVQLAKSFEIGSHSLTHRSLGALETSEQRREIKESIEILESKLSYEITHLAFPYGKKKDFPSEEILLDFPHINFFSTVPNCVKKDQTYLCIPRLVLTKFSIFPFTTYLLISRIFSYK